MPPAARLAVIAVYGGRIALLKPLRLGISGSSFIFVMPDELRVAAYVTPVRDTPVKLDERLNAQMLKITREMMAAVNEVGCALECYYSSAWDADAVLDVVLEDPKVEFWSVHGPYGRTFDTSAPDKAVRENAVAAYKDALDIAAKLGAKLVVAHPGANEDYNFPKDKAIELAIDPFRQIVDYAGEKGLRVAIEPLPKGEVGNSLDAVLDIVERIDRPNVGVNFDVNHVFPPEAIPAMIRQAGERIFSVHISDQDGVERHWLPFKGTLDWAEVLAALVDAGYTGPLIYETHIHDVATCEEAARMMVENYNRLIKLAPALA